MNPDRQFIRSSFGRAIFIYGDSLRHGHDFGVDDVDVCYGEMNCFGVTTCRCFSMTPEERIFRPEEHEIIRWRIEEDISYIPERGERGLFKYEIVYGMPLLGKGKSLMKDKTPDLYTFLMYKLCNRFGARFHQL